MAGLVEQVMSGEPKALDIPHFAVQSFTLLGSEHTLGLMCSMTSPALDEKGNVGVALTPQVFLSMPPLAAKELVVMLNRYITQVEADNGVITSDFLRNNEAK